VSKNALFVSAYKLFNEATVANIPRRSVVVVRNCKGERDDVYVVMTGKKVCSLTYNLEFQKDKVVPFSRITYYAGNTFRLFKELVSTDRLAKHEDYEIINEIIELGGKFDILTNKQSEIVELRNASKASFNYS
jgi:hypothetical protein